MRWPLGIIIDGFRYEDKIMEIWEKAQRGEKIEKIRR